MRELLAPTWKNLFYPPEREQYVYFEQASRAPFPKARNEDEKNRLLRGAWMADAAMLAYGRWGPLRMSGSDFQDILRAAGFAHHTILGDWAESGHGTQGYFAWNDRFAVTAFRGTERNDPTDSITDAEAFLVNEPDYSIAADEAHKALRHLQFIETLFAHGQVRVHAGFQRALNSVWEDVHSCLSTYRRDYPNSEVCFTGHSLGAALATLAVSRFGGRQASLFTFGSPRVGDVAFGDRVRRNADLGVNRFVNGNDPVARVPLALEGLYDHIERSCFYIAQGGKIGGLEEMPVVNWATLEEKVRALPPAGIFQALHEDAPPHLVDHSPARYCIQLWNACS